MSRSFLASLVAVLVTACAATGTPADGGGVGMDASGDASAPIDAGPDAARRDAEQPRDVGPVDAGCDLSTPVPTTIVGDPPDMLLIVDISGSMCTPLGLLPTGPSKLSIMKMALTTQVMEKNARINFGLMLYPHTSDVCAPGTVSEPITPRNAAPIVSRLASLRDDLFGCATSNSGATPTHTSVDAARAYYSTHPVNPIGRYALLATDGLPNCGAVLSDGSTEETVDETVAAIAALRAAGVTTYVLGFGSGFGADPGALDRMAVAGGTARAYSADSAGALDMALDTIAAEVIPPSCVIELEGPARDPALFQVSFDGGPLIPRDPSRSRGWDYDASTNTITFHGADCTTLQSGSVTNVAVDFGCPGPLI